MIISDTIFNTVKLYPEKEAIICGENRFTYGQFKKRIDLLAAALHEAGINKGDKIATLHSNCHIYAEIYYAVAQIGGVLVPLNTRLSSDELSFMLDDSQSKILFSQQVFEEKVLALVKKAGGIQKIVWCRTTHDLSLGEVDILYEEFLNSAQHSTYEERAISPDDIAQIYYTSGSTGRPKGVIMTHKNMTTHAMGTIVEYQITDEDVWFHVAPLFHMSDACNLWAITWAGGTHVFIGKVKPHMMLDYIEREKITMLKLVATMWAMLLSDDSVAQRDYSSLRLVISGGSPISTELVRRIIETFQCEYVQNYGMTESTHFLTISRLKEKLRKLPPEEQFRYRKKTGRPFFGVKIRVVDNDGVDVEPNGDHVGEIIAKGDIITPGYWRLPEENERAFKDGWLYTGDLATIDKEGYIQIVDRKKDMIVTGGENVFCIEVENSLCSHPGIKEAAVVGVPDPKWGEAVKAVCVMRGSQTIEEEDLIQFCKDKIAHYKAPKSVDFVEELPTTGSGKIDKKEIKRRYYQKQ
jgi:fatty-acyl-CoA synthase